MAGLVSGDLLIGRLQELQLASSADHGPVEALEMAVDTWGNCTQAKSPDAPGRIDQIAHRHGLRVDGPANEALRPLRQQDVSRRRARVRAVPPRLRRRPSMHGCVRRRRSRPYSDPP